MNNLRIDEVIREMDTERDYVVSLRHFFFMKTRKFQTPSASKQDESMELEFMQR